MNVNKLFQVIKDIALNVKTVRSAYDGDVYTIWNTNEVKYASFVAAITSAGKQDNIRVYNLVLYYGDRLTQNGKNKNSIWDDALNTLQSVINKLNSLEDVEIDDNYTIRLFEQKFTDDLAGGFVEVTVHAEDELGGCEINDIITEDESLVARLKEAIAQYEQENAELALLLKEIYYKVTGEILEGYEPDPDPIRPDIPLPLDPDKPSNPLNPDFPNPIDG